ncbi:MAG TPA: ABC transporter ATP-binding protein, partial [Rugosimonospora sp.]|nr:ABC transporter ATP-binding protein [Rugosimonospora sp.]
EQNMAVVRRLAGDAVVLAAGRVAWRGAAADLLADAPTTRDLLGVGTTAHSASGAAPALSGDTASGDMA